MQLFQKFQKIADGGPRRKTEKFWQIEKKVGDLYTISQILRIPRLLKNPIISHISQGYKTSLIFEH